MLFTNQFWGVLQRSLIGAAFALCGLGFAYSAVASVTPPTTLTAPSKPTLTDNGNGTWTLRWNKLAPHANIIGFDIYGGITPTDTALTDDSVRSDFNRYARIDLDNDPQGANCPATDTDCFLVITPQRGSSSGLGFPTALGYGIARGRNYFAVRASDWNGMDDPVPGDTEDPTVSVRSTLSGITDNFIDIPYSIVEVAGAEAREVTWDAGAGSGAFKVYIRSQTNLSVYISKTWAGLTTPLQHTAWTNLGNPDKFPCTNKAVLCETGLILPIMGAGVYYFGFEGGGLPGGNGINRPPYQNLGGRDNPVVFPTVANPPAPTSLTASHSANGVTLTWTKSANRHSRFTVYYDTETGVTNGDSSIFLRPDCINDTNNDATAQACTATIAYADLTEIENAATRGYFALEANINDADSPLSSEAIALPPPPTVSADGRTITFTQGATSTAENRVCAPLPNIMDGEGTLNHTVTGLPNWLEHRSDNGQQLCVKIGAEFAAPVTTAPHIRVTYRVTESGGAERQATASITIRVNALPPPPAASSGGGSSGAIALVAIAAGAYFWWKKRQLENGADPAAMALLPDVNFDLDYTDNRAFFTRINWKNAGNSNWQIRSNLQMHTKYSGKLLDWHANSHIGYRLNGKFGEFNPYLRGKFVQNAPENAKMLETYTLGVNYSVPNRFSVQFLQPDDEIWRYSLKTQVQLGQKFNLNFARPNSDLPDYSLGLRYQNPRGFGVSVTQPNSEINHYSLGIQWRGGSRIRYEFSGNTANNAIKVRGSFSF